MRMYAIALLAGIGLAGALWVLAPNDKAQAGEGRPHRSADAPERTAEAGSDQESRRLRAEVAALRREVRAAAIAPEEEEPAAPPADDGAPPLTHDEQVARVAARTNAVSADLRARVRAEAVDTRWARDTEAEVRETLEAEDLQGVQVTDVFCASTMCEVSLRSQLSGQALDETLSELTSRGPFRHGGFVNYGAGDGTIAMYVARAGHQLPPPPAQ